MSKDYGDSTVTRHKTVLSVSRSGPQMNSALASQLIRTYPSLGLTALAECTVVAVQPESSKSIAFHPSGSPESVNPHGSTPASGLDTFVLSSAVRAASGTTASPSTFDRHARVTTENGVFLYSSGMIMVSIRLGGVALTFIKPGRASASSSSGLWMAYPSSAYAKIGVSPSTASPTSEQPRAPCR